MHDKIQRYSLRKLSVGLASVMVGACIFSVNGKTVKADVTSDQTIQKADVQGQTATTQPQNEKKQALSAQNSVAEQSQKNLLDDLGKQKASAQSGDQAEVQENRLVDQINYKLTNNDSTDSKKDSGQNLTAPEATKQAQTDKNDVEKSIVSSSSTQQVNNQSNDHADDNSQTQNEQKLDITKNSQKLAKKVPATNLTQDNSTQKDYTPDINAWTGHDDGTYYILDKYTPQNDAEKDLIVIPNEADFEKAGKSTNGHEVGIPSYTVKNFMSSVNPKEVHFSETNGKKIKAIHEANNWFDWENSFGHSTNFKAITGTSFDVTEFNNISLSGLFQFDPSLTDISAVASWQFKPQYIPNMFQNDSSLTDLSPLSNWDISNVTNLGHTFNGCTNLTNIDALANWNTHNVKYFDNMFTDCPNLTDINIINNWDYSNAIASNNTAFGAYPLDDMFYGDHKIQINIGTNSGLADFIRRTGRIDAFHNSSNQITTSNTKLIELLTNTDFKAQNETTTAKRTITFSGLPANRAIPPIVQVINYTKLATAIIDMTGTSDSNAHGKIVSSGFEKDWKLDTSKQNDDVIINGVINFKPVKIPHINGYKCHLIKDPVNPTAYLLSFVALPQQNNQSTSNEPQQPSNVQSSQKNTQDKQKQPEPIQNQPAEKQEQQEVTQILNHIAFELMHNDSSDNADSFEPAQTDSAPLETASDSTQKDDAAKTQKVNAAKHKKHIVKKHVVKRHKKHAKKYHLKRRSRKHTKRAKKRIMNRRRTSKKFKKYSLKKHIKRV